jgi:membrane protein DedA with SNARE-associated domain
MEMSLRNQTIIVNLGILGGLIIRYYRGEPLRSLEIVAVTFVPVANVILLLRWRKRKRAMNKDG